jgi:hypothetical protein
MLSLTAVALWLVFGTGTRAQSYSATYLPTNAPNHSENGQSGTNQCGTTANQASLCQNAYINSIDDFCLWAPPEPGPNSLIGNVEQIVVAWCMKPSYGTRLIPDGTIKGAQFVLTPDYVQVTGIGDLTKINIPAGDGGGELDPHGADGNGNPVGGLVFSSAFGQLEEIHEWTNFVAANEFCFRACKPQSIAPTLCQHIYDQMGCMWNMPASYSSGFEYCLGDSGEPMGVYGTSTFHQGDPATPAEHPAPPSSSCTTVSTIGTELVISTTVMSTSTSASRSSAAATATPPPSSSPSTSPKSASQNGGSATKVAGWSVLAAIAAIGAAEVL